MKETNYILTSDCSFASEDQLLHSYNIAYVDLNENEMMHHKYLFKKKVNGKWRYYYNIGKANYVDGNTGKTPPSVKGYTWLEDKLGKDERDAYNRASVSYAVTQQKEKNRRYNSDYNEAVIVDSNRRLAVMGRKATEAQKEYMKTPLAKLEKASNTINKGRKKVSDWLRKQAKKLGIH